MMTNQTDIAWLAGIVDGEGCFSVKNPVKRGVGRTCHQVWLVLCNTSRSMVERAAQIVSDLGCQRPAIRRVWKGEKATRFQYWMDVVQKSDLLVVTKALLPHLTAKRCEAEVIVWFLTRACSVRAYKRTELDKVVLGCLSAVKRNGGEAPAEVMDLLREVIPSEAFLGSVHGRTDGGNERVETRGVRPNDNLPHECPAPQTN